MTDAQIVRLGLVAAGGALILFGMAMLGRRRTGLAAALCLAGLAMLWSTT